MELAKEEIESHNHFLLKSWVFFEVLFPLCLLTALWPVAKYFMNMSYAFERVYSAADLIPFASLLILAVGREIEGDKRLQIIGPNALDTQLLVAKFVPMLILVLYGFIKYRSMTYKFPSATGSVDDVIVAIAWFSIASVFFAVAFCYYVKRRLINERLEAI